jgi:hypothetical protein
VGDLGLNFLPIVLYICAGCFESSISRTHWHHLSALLLLTDLSHHSQNSGLNDLPSPSDSGTHRHTVWHTNAPWHTVAHKRPHWHTVWHTNAPTGTPCGTQTPPLAHRGTQTPHWHTVWHTNAPTGNYTSKLSSGFMQCRADDPRLHPSAE